MTDFNYLLAKLEAAEISSSPFPHIEINNFLDDGDFQEIVKSEDITLPEASSVDELFKVLDAASYKPIEFPGCTKSRAEYMKWLESNAKPKNTHEACEAKGMALRLMTPKSTAIRDLDAFFRTPEFLEVLSRKFGVTEPTTVDSGLQKYLHGYEISPHPDIRQKALTWMLNVNPGDDPESEDYHTHYMTLKPEWQFVGDFWRDHPDAETCWIPWDWCTTQTRQRANNSIVFFRPRHDTLHAVRAHYNHLPTQRTQFYGNLWYRPNPLPFKPTFTDFADGSVPQQSRNVIGSMTRAAAQTIGRYVDWKPNR